MDHSEDNGENGTMFDDPTEEELVKARSGKVTGIIIPPPEIRAIADKTAQWVAKNGKSFEQRILTSEEGKSAKFNFMRPDDVYNAYYEHKIRQFEEGVTAEPPEKKAKVDKAPEVAAKPKEGEATGQTVTATATTTIGKASVLGPIARAALNKPSEPPPPHEFFLVHPQGLTSLEVEIIKLTAQYTAASGRTFLAGLAQKEQRNPQFDFLKPTHLLFSYFTALVDAYSKILTPVAQQKERLMEGTDRTKALERCVHRWEHGKEEEEKKKAAKAEADAERVAYQALDWHDFVVVETINFAEDELLDVASGLEDGGQDDMDVDMDLEDEQQQAPPPPPPPPPPPRPVVSMDTDETEIKVVSDYTPRVATGYRAPETMFDPVSGKEVPISQVDEHMRIQFLDPRWREEQKRALEKKQESALAHGTDIAANVRSFAKKRTDIFGTVEEEERQLLEDQESRRRREEEANRIIWDGSAASAQMVQQKTAESAHLHRGGGGGQSFPGGPSIGPSAPGPPSRPPPPPPVHNFNGGPPPFGHMGGGGGMGGGGHMGGGGMGSLGGMGGGGGPMGGGGMGGGPPGPPPPPPGRPSFPPQQGGPPGPPMMMMQQQQQFQQQEHPPMGPPPSPPRRAPPPREPEPEPPSAGSLQPEDEFAAAHPGQVVVAVRCPEDDSNPAWNLRGQIISLTLFGVQASIKEVKELLTPMLGGMPPNKMQIKSPMHGFLKDQQSLASYNLAHGTQLELLTRSRGRR